MDKSRTKTKFAPIVIPMIAIAVASLIYFVSYKRMQTKTTVLKTALIEKTEKQEELEKRLSAAQSMLEDIGINHTIDPDIIEWAYKNSKSYVPKPYVIQYLHEAKKYPYYLMIVAIIKEESGFDVYARSKMNAKGLGQILTRKPGSEESVWVDHLIDQGVWQEEIDVFDYRKNIAAINYILKKYRKQFGSWKKVLFQYVNGDSHYITRVLSNYAELSLMLEDLDSQNSKNETDDDSRSKDLESQESPQPE
jgi:hypothetical protein